MADTVDVARVALHKTENPIVVERFDVTTVPLDSPLSTSLAPCISVIVHEVVNTLAHESLEVRPGSIVFGFATIITCGVRDVGALISSGFLSGDSCILCDLWFEKNLLSNSPILCPSAVNGFWD
ncbi:hypothetical protein A2673_01715 [Candidatus Kaiserbacteria bacterium RIFCSPHIGHO2_01_FULL_50_13]|uniref:Uncharacterized protein n=1 Tax=Candidatus Kaiserbacteria bacterium RIFCSPLOWO2_01_FULL_50_24 TaxID=1798507 RepID=A0A1F6EIH7_9BACT|nr:MAG: hypothetical protein A2673_01715 [Candidatus Kaiserbacteria bacterium RIFCSPHIGHO2_01_FULL_50_13]OGG73456.1 MAG: hypothetical protein A3A34_02565 [Candidatus Kaiserbacteria bacterium RIFCSPLOWO2_01_FULL_50_24]OGG82266.1 MAG: hypothetical protein A3H74_03965 [Candidatus Kaiserbacteria bacterium RIFCSPLOWO2_02_FULL_51_13]